MVILLYAIVFAGSTGCVGVGGGGAMGGINPLSFPANIVKELHGDGYRATCTTSNETFTILFSSFRVRGKITGKMREDGVVYHMNIDAFILMPGARFAVKSAAKTVRRAGHPEIYPSVHSDPNP